MIRKKNKNGFVNINTDVYVEIAGTAASNCMGVKGMAARSIKDGFYDVNLPVIGKEIMDEVRYMVEKNTSVKVRNVNVYIDSMMIG